MRLCGLVVRRPPAGGQDIGAFFKEEKPLGGINQLNVIKVGRRVDWKHVEATC